MQEFLRKYGIFILLLFTIPVVIFSENNLFNSTYNKLFKQNKENSNSIIKSSIILPEMNFMIFHQNDQNQLKKEEQIFSTKKMIGEKYVLNFFASWCGYCMDEYDEIAKLKNKIPIYGIAWRDSPEKIREIINIRGNAYEKILLDPFGSSSAVLNIQGIPLTIIVNSKGEVVFAKAGQITSDEILKEFEKAK